MVSKEDAFEDIFGGILPLSDEQSLHTVQVHTVPQQKHDGDCGDFRLPKLIDDGPAVLRGVVKEETLRCRGVHIAHRLVFSDDLAHGHKGSGRAEKRFDLAHIHAWRDCRSAPDGSSEGFIDLRRTGACSVMRIPSFLWYHSRSGGARLE